MIRMMMMLVMITMMLMITLKSCDGELMMFMLAAMLTVV